MRGEYTDALTLPRIETTNGAGWALNGRRVGIIGRGCDLRHVLHPPPTRSTTPAHTLERDEHDPFSLGTRIGYLPALCAQADVLERLPTQSASRIDELLPHRWQICSANKH
jgi:hypothetical protein